MANKQQLREILFAISSPEEKDSYLKSEKLDEVSNTVKEVMEKVSDDTSNEAIINALKNLTIQVSKLKPLPVDHAPVVDAIERMTKELSVSNKPHDMSGFFKDFSLLIGETGKDAKDTKELIQTLKWNSTMGLKNQNGSPISPAVSPFQIPDYTSVQISNYSGSNPGTVQYYLGTQLVATLAITYDGSGNVTSVTRT